jgi:hypothetical protein
MAGTPAAQAPAPMQFAQLIVRKQVIIRSVRVHARQPQQNSSPITWHEGKKIKCLPVGSIAGASLLGQNSVDFILRDRSRIRARLDSTCPALDYYHGFYVSPGSDGMVCADRDFVRSRMGRECGIDVLRRLRPVVQD